MSILVWYLVNLAISGFHFHSKVKFFSGIHIIHIQKECITGKLTFFYHFISIGNPIGIALEFFSVHHILIQRKCHFSRCGTLWNNGNISKRIGTKTAGQILNKRMSQSIILIQIIGFLCLLAYCYNIFQRIIPFCSNTDGIFSCRNCFTKDIYLSLFARNCTGISNCYRCTRYIRISSVFFFNLHTHCQIAGCRCLASDHDRYNLSCSAAIKADIICFVVRLRISICCAI